MTTWIFFKQKKGLSNWEAWRRFNRTPQSRPCRLLQFGFFSWANSQLSCSMVLGDEFGSWPAAADLILCDVAASLASPLVRLSWVLNSGHPKCTTRDLSSLSVWNFIQLTHNNNNNKPKHSRKKNWRCEIFMWTKSCFYPHRAILDISMSSSALDIDVYFSGRISSTTDQEPSNKTIKIMTIVTVLYSWSFLKSEYTHSAYPQTKLNNITSSECLTSS